MSLTSTFLLIRVDDRLMHGQVTLGWGNELAPRQYLIVDDQLAFSPMEAELFRLVAPEGTHVHIFSPKAFLEEMGKESVWDRAILILRDIPALLALIRGGFHPPEINLGGIHRHAGATEVLPYLFLSHEDWDGLEEVAASGAQLYAQELPGRPSHRWVALRDRKPNRAG
ncbi:MAG: PTS sugar transporter subunit IIB [Candidatus Eisenbacteria bacterium]|uniref:PTS sugar transporter subunit IIB n=1 Tax=Eiseniibacteriota bacterium TaxID=2212470 RepID=A0A948W5B3_UNCEI|nr:PTS sugar transporter subunit IIB [Candidatus Eisenbacteria bacterium]MBU1948973.1 PTS sugar transporter subunit IIB [Candidatus Eisenbacteria bacterium]MBU2689830.1 PTS sugar transporter subunit IIB [Candidatus Eisenbacteria bacterium]